MFDLIGQRMRLKRNRHSGSFAHVRLAAAAAIFALVSSILPAYGADGSGSATGSKLERVTYGSVSATATAWPVAVAKELKLDHKHGLDITVIYTGGVSASIQQLAAGSLDLAESTIEQYIRSINQGIPAKMVGGSVLPFPYLLVAKPEIKSLKDLKGHWMALAAKKDPTYYLTTQALEKLGVKPDQWTASFVGSTTNRYAALKSGGVDAAALAPPFSFTALREGYHSVLDLNEVDPNYGFTALGATDKTIKDKPEMVKAFLRVYGEAADWLLDLSNESQAKQILTKMTKATPADANDTYNLYIKKLKAFAPHGLLPDRYVVGVQEQLVKLGDQQQVNEVSKYVWMPRK